MITELRSRVRPRVRRFAMAALIVLAPIASWTVWDYVEAQRLARLVDEIRAQGQPVSLASPAADAGRGHAARYYEAAAALIDMTGVHESTGLLQRLDFSAVQNASTLTSDLRAWLDRNRDAEQLLEKAGEWDEYPRFSDFTRQANGMLRVATLADLRAIERIHARDGVGAAEAVIRQLKIARILQAQTNDLAVLTSALVIGRAASVIPQILELNPPLEMLARLRSAIAFADRDDVIAQLVLTERAFVLGRYWDADRRWFASPTAPTILGRRFSEPVWFAMRPYVMHLIVRQVKLMTAFLENSSRPWPERSTVVFTEISREPARTNSRLYFLTLPYSRWAAVNSHRTRTTQVSTLLAGVRSVVTALAVEQHRRSKAGGLPSRLDDLVPEHLSAVPIDPFSGHPLLYKVFPDSYVVYSVASNGKDDDGAGAGTQLRRRWGANQTADAPADIGMRVKHQTKH